MSTRTICGQPWTATSGPRARSAADSPEPGPEPPERGRPPPSTTAPRPSAHGPRPTRSRSRRAAASRRASSSGSARPATDTQPGDRTGQSCLVLSSVHPPREPPTRRGFRTDPPADAPIRDSWLTRPAAGGRLWQQRAGGAPNRPSGVPERPALSGGRRNTFRAGGVGVVAEWRRVGDERQQRFWELVTSGASSSQACEAVGVNRRQGYRWRRDSGGQPPPAPRGVAARYLSLEERLQIADLHLAGASRRAIAAQLGRAPSTISRELRRNGPGAGRAGRARYAPYAAHKRAGLRARRPKPFKLDDARLALAVQDKLCLKWSPAQIRAHLAGEAWRQGGDAGEPRDHLPGVVRAGPRPAAHRVASASAHRSGLAPTPRVLRRDHGEDLRHGLDQRAAGRSRRPRGARPLGRRPDPGPALPLGDRHPGRAPDPLLPAGPPARRARRPDRARPAGRGDHDPARAAAPLADLGPGHRAGPAPGHHAGHGHGDLLLRSALALAAREQREHQRPTASVLPQGHRPLGPQR